LSLRSPERRGATTYRTSICLSETSSQTSTAPRLPTRASRVGVGAPHHRLGARYPGDRNSPLPRTTVVLHCGNTADLYDGSHIEQLGDPDCCPSGIRVMEELPRYREEDFGLSPKPNVI